MVQLSHLDLGKLFLYTGKSGEMGGSQENGLNGKGILDYCAAQATGKYDVIGSEGPQRFLAHRDEEG